MSNGRILTQAEMDRAHLSQLEAENAALEWKHLAAEANAQISIAAQAIWRTRALAAEAKVKELEAEVSALRTCADYAYKGHVFYEAHEYDSDTFMSLYADAVAAQVRDRAALSQQGGEI